MKNFFKILSIAALMVIALGAFSGDAFAQKGLQKALDAQRAHNPNFFNNDGVVATGVSMDSDGNAFIKVYTKDKNVVGVPFSVNGVKVKKSVSGVVFAGDNPAAQARGGKPKGGGTNPQTRLSRPVPIGVSVGTYRPAASNICFAGTLGCRLKRTDIGSGTVSHYILSNNHVLAEENQGTIGVDQVIQPGTLDNSCTLDLNDIIGELADFSTIQFGGAANSIDAAIATTTTADTGFASPSGAYGAPSANTLEAYVGLPVQKYGRTTSFTKGEVDAINVTVNVTYDGGVATFTNQIIFVGKATRGKKIINTSFSDSGDSGSLIVSQGNNDPVALLFAGNGSITIGNPIDTVLATFSDPGNGVFFSVDDGN